MSVFWRVNRKVDLAAIDQGVEQIGALLVRDAQLAHRIEVTVLDGGEPADLSGYNVKAHFIRADDASFVLDGALVGKNKAVITLGRACYAMAGKLSLVLVLQNEEGVLPLYACRLRVLDSLTDTIVDPENVIPSLSDLLAQIDAMRTATAASLAATKDAVAVTGEARGSAAAAKAGAQRAEAAALAIDGLSVGVTPVAATEPPSATVADYDGKKHIQFYTPAPQSAVITQVERGMFALYVDDAGNLVLAHDEADAPPPLVYDAASGELRWVFDEEDA